MSRTDEKGAAGLSESGDAREDDDGDRGNSALASGPSMGRARGGVTAVDGEGRVADEAERTRLIADIMQLLRDPSMPEATRVAGLTLVGWLARRRSDEVPHAIGVDEARDSERRLRIARAKVR